ncbi:GNAT family N-acetyltransferase [Wenyingzhuangia aestuarii]|uniref:GNAT family N-acetyltransferase n=1 Tax=Wenyingzhuangia aestuarii TaxID=1647582 RepID=UPI00143C508B|nr:GNAT family N-acetyltransferase [Wenyingzhuangia aestuarii]NJB84226.1 ribosomal protein S18 acetylase RimI-like enzyme [Wenyingzhuangia aestuarii]
MKILTNNKITPELEETIVKMLVQYNSEKIDSSKYINEPLEIIIKDDNNDILGGIYGRSIWGTLEIKTFVIKDNYRNQGIGSKLIKAAENEALKRKCNFISLDTFSFQAPGFYEKKGFEKIGTETNYPQSHDKYYYRKKLK